jgi:hypothetical protein
VTLISQDVKVAAPSEGHMLPGGHVWHAVWLVWPKLPWYVPAGQRVQSAKDVAPVNVP